MLWDAVPQRGEGEEAAFSLNERCLLAWARGQIVEGDIITSINGVDISNMGMAEIMPIIGQSPVVELIIA